MLGNGWYNALSLRLFGRFNFRYIQQTGIRCPDTNGSVGFPAKNNFQLDELSLQTNNPFAVILITTMEKNRDISTSGRIVVTTVALGKNTGMELNEDTTRLLRVGTAPVLLEHIQVSLTIKRKEKASVYVLDHSGNRSNVKIPVINGQILLD